MELVIGNKISTFDHIIDHIFLGDIESAQSDNIDSHNIKVIINISNSRYEKFPNIEYYVYDIDDYRTENITQFFSSFLSICASTKSNILVHCANSVSRSVTLVLVYLMQTMTLRDSIDYLMSKRTQYTKPNSGFMKQLIEYEYKKYNNNSIIYSEFVKKCIGK